MLNEYKRFQNDEPEQVKEESEDNRGGEAGEDPGCDDEEKGPWEENLGDCGAATWDWIVRVIPDRSLLFVESELLLRRCGGTVSGR